MKKSKRAKDPATETRRRLAKAQESLRRSQEKRALAAAKGKLEVEDAYRRAEARLKKATLRLERKAGEVTKIEGRLLTLASKPAPLSSNVSPQRHELKTSSPQSEGAEDLSTALQDGGTGYVSSDLAVPPRDDSSGHPFDGGKELSNGSEREPRELHEKA